MNVATPCALSGDVPNTVEPLRNCTDPAGVPVVDELMMLVKVTGVVRLAFAVDEVNVIVLGACVTVSVPLMTFRV